MTQWILTCCLFATSLVARGQVIDALDYPDDSSACQAWRAVAERGELIAVSVQEDQGRHVLEMPLPFASQPDIARVYMDRDIAVDLSTAGELRLEVQHTEPAAGGRLSLYFRSGQGWYAAGSELAGSGWQRLRFSKASFAVEGQPAGWDKIDAVRIAVWRGRDQDVAVRLRALMAVQHDVAVVIPASDSGGESRAALQASEDVAEMLSELGLGSDAIEDTALPLNALGDRRVAILAYNPGLSAESAQLLVQFVQQGGKLLVCYQLPGPLGTALGFAQPQYVRPDDSAKLAEVRFDSSAVPGLPSSVRQASWNITTARPAGFNARIIGHWYDADGQATDYPAMLLSDRGAFFSHIILRDDRDNKKRMLAAILGHLAPDLWKQMADNALEQSGRVGHCAHRDELLAYLTETPMDEVAALVESAEQARLAAQRKAASGAYAEAVDLAAEMHDKLVQAYLRAQPSKTVEGRAFWNHSGTGAYDGDWERTARELSRAGFNMVLPNMLWGGLAHYASDVLPRSTTYEKYGDQIDQCVTAAHKHGLEVHVWKVNWNLSGAPRDFVARIRRENRHQVSVDGAAHDWLCPSHPENFQLELDSMLEVARRYDVDGLHFDYIRYPDRTKCYCQGCRERFEAHLGRTVARWPGDCYSGALRDEYLNWRCDQITRLVEAVHEQAKLLRPAIDISAAVFGAYPDCRASVGQDWPRWIEAGYLDFVCPMDYTQIDQAFVKLVTHQLQLVDGRIPVYPGIGQWRLSDDRTVGQIHLARQLGAPGFTLFDLTGASIQTAVPAVQSGVGREKTTVPHRN